MCYLTKYYYGSPRSQITVCEVAQYRFMQRSKTIHKSKTSPQSKEYKLCCCNVNACVYVIFGYMWASQFGSLATQGEIVDDYCTSFECIDRFLAV